MFKNKKIHFIGIGGISMSGIAELLYKNGSIISGSDIKQNKCIDALLKKDIKVTIGEDASVIDDVDIVVYTAAISETNKELVRARELNKEVYERADFLGLMTTDYENVLCISGTHGKSTTTGMVASCFLEAKTNPTIQLGAYLPKINANYYVGDKKYFIMEACEYVDSFLSFHPTSEIILNIDNDHLDYFKNLDNIKKSFEKYINLLPKDGFLIINNDDENSNTLNIPNKITTYTFGINNESVVMAKNIGYNDYGYPSFDVYLKNEFYLHIDLSVMGIHNVYNALATIAMCICYNLDKEAIYNGLKTYKGVERRFEYIGTTKNDVLIYDDYAHHPTEIEATYNSAKNIKCHENWAVFQSHTFSRTKEHLKEFADILKKFDNIVIAPIFPAREINTFNVKEEDLVELILPDNKNVIYIDNFDDIKTYLEENVKANDVIITIGAGPINEVGKELLK